MRTVVAGVLRSGKRGAAAADDLCLACLPLLGVDSAAVSLIDDVEIRSTFGASADNARLLGALAFTTGEGPCLDAARTMTAVLVPDLHADQELRWPAFGEGAERAGIRAVFTIPVRAGQVAFGTLDLSRSTPGPLTMKQLADAALVADAAAHILLTAAGDGGDDTGNTGPVYQPEQLASMDRVEVYRATGMIMAQLKIPSALALIRLRAYAFAHDQPIAEVARLVVSRELRLEP